MSWLSDLHSNQPVAHAISTPFFGAVVGRAFVSMSEPPALALATNITGSDAPTVGHSRVYPPTTLMRPHSARNLTTLCFP